MDTSVSKEVIEGLIRFAQRDRASKANRLADEDPDLASDQWLFTDLPFVNELCLILLVVVWHQVERELIRLAAFVTEEGKMISREQYQKNVQDERDRYRNKKGRKQIIEKLKLDSFPEWKSSMKTLQLLANSYKHDPSVIADERLLKHLNLGTANYMPLPESNRFQQGLAGYLNLPQNAEYCDIAEELINRAGRFLAELKEKTEQTGRLSTWSPVNFGDLGMYGV